MSEVAASRFSCDGCGKSYAWKEELAGKRAKCKCGTVMTVPTSPTVHQEDDGYDLAPSEHDMKPAARPRVPLAPRRASSSAPVESASPVGVPMASAAVQTLPYQRGPTQRERERASSDITLDKNRDIHAPIAFLVIGMLLYIAQFAVQFHMDMAGVMIAGVGVIILVAIKAAFMIGFAFMVAGWAGVSFGGIGTAALKLAAIAAFCDGTTSWVDMWVSKISGGMGGGFFGFSAISFPVALGIYWMLLIYLFSMDSGDAWMVVMLLSVFDRIVKMVLGLVLLGVILGWAGASIPSLGGGGSGGSGVSAQMVAVDEMKDNGELEEARKVIANGKQAVLTPYVEAWYAAGCKNVWFEVADRDINGRITLGGLVIELPNDKEARAKCFKTLKDYYDSVQMPYDPSEVTDDGKPYIFGDIK